MYSLVQDCLVWQENYGCLDLTVNHDILYWNYYWLMWPVTEVSTFVNSSIEMINFHYIPDLFFFHTYWPLLKGLGTLCRDFSPSILFHLSTKSLNKGTFHSLCFLPLSFFQLQKSAKVLYTSAYFSPNKQNDMRKSLVLYEREIVYVLSSDFRLFLILCACIHSLYNIILFYKLKKDLMLHNNMLPSYFVKITIVFIWLL